MSVDSVKSNVSTNVQKITGDKGSHDSSTSTGKAANAGEEVGKALNGGEKDINTKSDISYSSKTEDGKLDVKAGLDYANEVVDSIDENDDGGITLDKKEETKDSKKAEKSEDKAEKKSEQQKAEEALGIEDISVADINADGLVDRAEYLSMTIVQDCTGDEGTEGVLDAIASAEEAKALNAMIKEDAAETKAQIALVHDGLVAEHVAKFEPALTKAEKARQITKENETKIEKNKANAEEAKDKAIKAEETKAEKTKAEETKAEDKDSTAKKSDKPTTTQNETSQEDVKKLLTLFLLSQQMGIPFELLCNMLGLDAEGLFGQGSPFGALTASQDPFAAHHNAYKNIAKLFFQDSDPTDDLLNPYTIHSYI